MSDVTHDELTISPLDESALDAVGGGTWSSAKTAAMVCGAAAALNAVPGAALVGAVAAVVYFANKEGDGVCFW